MPHSRLPYRHQEAMRSKLARVAIWLLGAAAPLLALNPNHQITQYVHRIWQAQPGLSHTSIYAVTQTSDGYLWLGTQNGVVRFDGVRFSPIAALQQASLGDIWARAIEQDTAGNVWITSNDLSLIRVSKNGAVKVFTEKDGLPTKDYSCLVPGPDGEMWACTDTGLVRFQGDHFTVHSFPAPMKSRPIAACRAGDGNIWLGGGSAVNVWNGSAFSRVPLRSVTGDLVVRSLLCTGKEVWIGTFKGLVHLKDGREDLFTSRQGLADDVILSLAHGENGEIWAGTRNGFSRLRNGAVESYGYREGLSQNAVFALREDREGSLWVATKNGLNQFLDGASTRYTKSEGLPSENMGPLLEDSRGNLWAGTLDAGLARFNGRRFTSVPSLNSGRITTLAESADGALWVGTDNGLKRLEGGRVQASYGVEQGLPSPQIRSLFKDHTGNLWVGTRKGPAMLRDGHFLSPPALSSDLAAPIVAMGETRDGTMLFAVEHGGVYLYKGGIPVRLEAGPGETPPGLTSRFQDVNAIYTDPDGVVWMGLDGAGLAIWRNGKLSRFLVRDGLFDSEIYGFVPEPPDRLWMACSSGFFSVSRAEVFKFADGKARKIVSTPYGPLDGLRTVQGTPGVQPVGTRAKDGRLWFSSSVWLLALTPDFGFRNVLPPVTVETVTVNGTNMPLDGKLTLNSGQNNVAFEYTALTFRAPQRVNFRYMLEGYDKKWTDAGTRREAFYTNLPPGTFHFRVAACGGTVPCNETEGAVQFEILPRVYQRVWFYPSCAAMLALLVWLSYRARVRRLHDQFALVLAERSRIARELHDTLIQGFSGITMQLHAFVSRLRSSDDRQALGDIIRDAGICLQETRRSVAGLRAGTGSSSGLAAAIADAARQLTEERDLRLKMNLDDVHQELPAEVKYNLLCIVQEAITNCIKHAGARTVEVTMAYASGELQLTVADDGRGFVRGQTRGAGEGHYGLIGMRERASQIGGDLEVSSSPGFGTTVSVRVPVTRDVPVASPHARLEAIR